jgi:hypothetical protein
VICQTDSRAVAQDLYDSFSDENPLLAGMTAASVRRMIATKERAGLPVRRVLSDPAKGCHRHGGTEQLLPSRMINRLEP